MAWGPACRLQLRMLADLLLIPTVLAEEPLAVDRQPTGTGRGEKEGVIAGPIDEQVPAEPQDAAVIATRTGKREAAGRTGSRRLERVDRFEAAQPARG